MAQAAIMAPELIQAATQAADKAATLTGEFIHAMETPIYQSTKTVVHHAKNGDVITRTEGWTIPLGLPLGLLAIFAGWEALNWLSQAVQGIHGEAVTITTVMDMLNPTTWLIDALATKPGVPPVRLPPSLMAHLEYLGTQILAPGSAGLNEVLSAISKYMTVRQ